MAVSGARRVLFGNSKPLWLPNAGNPPDIAINWTTNQAWKKGGGLTTPATLGVTTSRASVKQVVDSNGNWSQVAANVTAMSDLGRSTEEARTNSIRNNTMQGAVAGSPGTGPTNWVITSSPAALVNSIPAVSTESGIDYLDVRLNGTSNATAGTIATFESTTGIAATNGQTWSASIFLTLSAGTLSSFVPALRMSVLSNVGAVLQNIDSSALTPVVGALGLFRLSVSGTISNAGAANIVAKLIFSCANGTAYDLTLRIGWPQLENNGINSTVASATVAAGGTTGVTGTAVYSVGGGTGTAATLNVTVSGGAITAINSVASAGSYTVFPPSPAALTYVSGTGSGVVGATVNLTPTNLAANAFATSPIKTTAGAGIRSADLTTLAVTVGSALTLFTNSSVNGQVPNVFSRLIDVSGNVNTDEASIYYQQNTSFLQADAAVASAAVAVAAPTNTVPFGSIFKVAFSLAANNAWVAQNGVLGLQQTTIAVPAVTTLGFGRPVRFQPTADMLAKIDAIWLTQAVPSAQLASMTI